MKKVLILIALAGLIGGVPSGALALRETDPGTLSVLKAEYPKKHKASVDHSKFQALDKKFGDLKQVTAACLSCHNKAQDEVMHTSHWTWDRGEYIPGRGVVYFGKKNAINNFCISTPGNEKSCAKCHPGYGRNADGSVPKDPDDVDCLVCHDNSETYAKGSDMGGAPDPKVDLGAAARSVGLPRRANCGICHFFGGGGNNVKHGDLEKAQFEPSRELDVHMAQNGANMQCVDCHLTENHEISGKMYSLSSMDRNRVTCERCHTASPHKDRVINEHTAKVACQSCHIPLYAKANSTKVFWDWSTAGKLRDGKPYSEEDERGNHTYLSIKGSFKWGDHLKPEYAWSNGTASHYLSGDKVEDTSNPLVLNPLYGSYSDDNAKIIPVKVHRANQPFDPVNKTLIQPKLYADRKGEGGFWKDFDWQSAARLGMKKVGLPFSGKITFIRTDMNWPLNHMVAPKEETLKCSECHERDGGRLAGLNGFYLPGRDRSKALDILGKLMLIVTLLGVLLHGAGRIISRRAYKGGEKK